jgi:hypothetical protein
LNVRRRCHAYQEARSSRRAAHRGRCGHGRRHRRADLLSAQPLASSVIRPEQFIKQAASITKPPQAVPLASSVIKPEQLAIQE